MSRQERMGLAEKLLKGEEVLKSYSSNPTQNAVLMLAGIDHSREELENDEQLRSFYGALSADYKDKPESSAAKIRDYIGGNGASLGRLVLEDLTETIFDVSRQVMPGYLLKSKPKEGLAGVDPEFLRTYSNAHKANTILNDPEALKEETETYQTELIGKLKSPGMVVAVEKSFKGNPNLALNAVKRRYLDVVKKFAGLFEDNDDEDAENGLLQGRDYIMALFNSITQEGEKLTEAIKLGRASYESEVLRRQSG